MDDKLLSILACPKCHSSLSLENKGEKNALHCPKCQVFYPVVDEIPVLLIEEAVSRQTWDNDDKGN